MTTTTLADVAATSLRAVRTLERYSLDYCCGELAELPQRSAGAFI